MSTTRPWWITQRPHHVLVVVLALLAVACGARTVEVDPAALAASPTPPAVPVATPSTAEVPPTPEAPPQPQVPSVEPAPAPAVQDDACPDQLGPSVRYSVLFHEWPDGLEVGQELSCGRVLKLYEELTVIAVEVWDEEDFMDRVFEDPNVREAGPSGGASCTALGCPGQPPAGDEPG